MVRGCRVVISHQVTVPGVVSLPTQTNRKYVESQSRDTKDEAIRAYRLFNPNRWNLKMAAWRAKR
jgi:hypothetical protein